MCCHGIYSVENDVFDATLKYIFIQGKVQNMPGLEAGIEPTTFSPLECQPVMLWAIWAKIVHRMVIFPTF